MNFNQLQALVAKGEGLQIEFKLKIAHPDKVLKGVSAFANSKGGHLLIGVEDSGKITGLKEADQEAYLLQANIEQHMQPIPDYTISYIEVGNRQVVDFFIKAGQQKPYYIQASGANEIPKAYVRLGDQSIQASREMRELMKLRRKDRPLRFQFGEKEEALMKYLEQKEFITVQTYADLLSMPKAVASRTLVLLTACKVLEIKPFEGGADEFRRIPE
jgi:predicted HTH transcriptional regulator